MRAAPWLHNSTIISSPLMSLDEAISEYTKLLSAKKVSWEMFRKEWVPLLVRKRKGQTQARSWAEAEAIADKARHLALEHHCRHAENFVKVVWRDVKANVVKSRRLEIKRARRLAEQHRRWLTRN